MTPATNPPAATNPPDIEASFAAYLKAHQESVATVKTPGLFARLWAAVLRLLGKL